LVAVGRGGIGGRLRALRLARGLSQSDLARLIGRHQTVVGPYERNEYAPPGEIVERLASALGTSPEYLLFGREPRRSMIEVVGRVAAAGLVAMEDTLLPVGLQDGRLVALRIEDECMAPTFRPGQLILIGMTQHEPSSCLGRDSLAELEDGRQLLRRLLPAASPGRFDLAAYNAPIINAVSVRAARPVLGALWGEAFADEKVVLHP
jgi:transcriptional regulator with XRE-family HTH domain